MSIYEKFPNNVHRLTCYGLIYTTYLGSIIHLYLAWDRLSMLAYDRLVLLEYNQVFVRNTQQRKRKKNLRWKKWVKQKIEEKKQDKLIFWVVFLLIHFDAVILLSLCAGCMGIIVLLEVDDQGFYIYFTFLVSLFMKV